MSSLRISDPARRPPTSCAPFDARFETGFRRLLRLHAPELKARFVDCFLDRGAGKAVRRSLVVADHAGGMPGAVLPRQLAAGGIAGGGPPSAGRLRFEYEDPQFRLPRLRPRARALDQRLRNFWRTGRRRAA